MIWLLLRGCHPFNPAFIFSFMNHCLGRLPYNPISFFLGKKNETRKALKIISPSFWYAQPSTSSRPPKPAFAHRRLFLATRASHCCSICLTQYLSLGPPKMRGTRWPMHWEHIFGKTFRRWADTFVSFLVSKMKIGYRLISLIEEQ